MSLILPVVEKILCISIKKRGKMEQILITNALNKKYGDVLALENVSMHIPKGAIYGFVGKNGAGKTTLIRLICGLQEPTSGEYKIFGIDSKDKNIIQARQKIGAEIETPSIYLNMTAEENIKHQQILLGVSNEKNTEEILRLVGLEKVKRKIVRNFSLGMKQRLGIAIALVGNPEFIILDEPINGLDPQGIIEIRELVLNLNREKQITFLISSHILSELSLIATHYGFIDNGKLIQEISAQELEQNCRKRVRIKVSDIAALVSVLDNMNIKYKLVSNNIANIYGAIHITNLVVNLNNIGCEVLSYQEEEEAIEDYYMTLIGGEQK